MKHTKSILMAALAALSITAASAQTTIWVTGSTAFRSAANTAIDEVVSTQGGRRLAQSTNSLSDAGNVAWVIGNTNIVAFWSGSEAGLASVAGPQITRTNSKGDFISRPNLMTFWDPSQTFSTNPSGVPTTTPQTTQQIADISFSDTYQAASAYRPGVVAIFNTNNLDPNSANGLRMTNRQVLVASNQYTAIAPTNDILVGAVTYAFISSQNGAVVNGTNYSATNGAIANITRSQAADLFKRGRINAAQFTGSLSDTNRFVFAVGRGIDSGTRVVAHALLGLGTALNTTVDKPLNTGISNYLILGTNTGIAAANANSGTTPSTFVRADGTSFSNTASTLLITNFPADVSQGILCGRGFNGYASGGNLCRSIAAVNSTNSPSNAIVIGYAGLSDASGRNCNILAYDGVYPSTGAVMSGAYPFWSYEHIMINNNSAGKAGAFAKSVADIIRARSTVDLQVLAKGSLQLSDVTNNISRPIGTEGSTILRRSPDQKTAANRGTYPIVTTLPAYFPSAKPANAGVGPAF